MCWSYGDCEPFAVQRSSTPVARKLHKCDECHGPIPPGTKYRYDFGVYDKIAESWRRHLECIALVEMIEVEYCGAESDEFIPMGHLLEEVAQYEDQVNGDGFTEYGDYIGIPGLVIERETGEHLHGPGTLHGAIAAIQARYAPAPAPASA